MPLFFWSDLFLEARAEILKKFRLVFGRNDDIINSFWNLLTFRSILALKTKRKNAHGLFIVGTYHISFYLSVAAAHRWLDLIHKQRILSDKLCAESAARNIPNFRYGWIYQIIQYVWQKPYRSSVVRDLIQIIKRKVML